MKSLRVGLVGAGRMGQLHGRVYSELRDVQLIGVVDIDKSRAEALAEKCRTEVLPDVEALAELAQAVSIASPTETHLQVAEVFLNRGIPVLIEKPIALTSEQGRKILDLARKYETFVQVGHSERFNPAVRALEGYNIRPRLIEAVRVSPFPFRSMDIGAVLDLMVHDIDLVLHLADAEPISVDAIGASVLGPDEDLADARLRFTNGCVVKLTCSRIALETQRSLRLFCDDMYISLDLHRKSGFVIKKSDNTAKIKEALSRVECGEVNSSEVSWSELIHSEPLKITEAEPMRLQLENFVDCVRTGEEPIVTGQDGTAALATAEAILRAIKSNQV